MAEKLCPVPECTDPKCVGSPHLHGSYLDIGWIEGHRAAAIYGKRLRLALVLRFNNEADPFVPHLMRDNMVQKWIEDAEKLLANEASRG